MASDAFDMATYRRPEITSKDAMLGELHELAPAEKALDKDNDIYWQSWTMKRGDKALMRMPRCTRIRSAVMNPAPPRAVRCIFAAFRRSRDLRAFGR